MNQNRDMSKIEALIQTTSSTLNSWSTRRFLITIVVIQILFHIPIVHLPPMGQHTWRQIMGLSTARNYYEDNNAFFHPAQDVRVEPNDKGVIYFEFPLLYWITGQSYHLTGFSHINGRLMMLIMGIFLIFGSYKLSRSLGLNEVRARWFTFFVSFSPYFFYYSISSSPNMPALTWFIWGIALIIPPLEQRHWNWKYWLGIIFLSLGILSKATYLFFGLPVAYLFLLHYYSSRNPKTLIVAFISFIVIILPNILIYLHSKNLFDQAPFERARYAILRPRYFPSSWKEVTSTLRPAIADWFLQMYVNTVAIPFFLFGCYAALKNKKWKTKIGGFYLMWLLSFFIFSLFFFTQFREHAYYLTPLLIFAAMGNTYGIDLLWRKKKLRLFVCFLLICVPIVMVGRVGHRWLWAKQVPEELLYQSDEFEKVIPVNERVLVFGDDSPVVYLYYLHRKGISLHPSVSIKDLQRYNALGFKYIVSELPMQNVKALNALKIEKVTQIGDFRIYRIVDSN